MFVEPKMRVPKKKKEKGKKGEAIFDVKEKKSKVKPKVKSEVRRGYK